MRENHSTFFIKELIFNHGGTIYYDIASVEFQQLVKNRAEFLFELYYILSHEEK